MPRKRESVPSQQYGLPLGGQSVVENVFEHHGCPRELGLLLARRDLWLNRPKPEKETHSPFPVCFFDEVFPVIT